MPAMNPDTEPAALPDGLDGSTGAYLHPPAGLEEILALANAKAPGRQETSKMRGCSWGGPRIGVDPKDLASAGWGVVFPRDENPAVREALAPLLDHRRKQAAAKKETFYRDFSGAAGFQPDDTKASFLERHGAGGASPADPREVPYFLLLVGGPEEIPFELQHQLAVQYAVGRVGFDTPEEYASYAASVVAAETGEETRCPPRAVFFGVRNPGDLATARMSDYLVRPIAEALAESRPEWEVETVLAEAATKARLGRLLGGEETPSFLFTACHGMGFPPGDPRQRPCQGALLCQDWPGPGAPPGPLPADHYFSAADVGDEARPAGLVTFHFACHSGGTPGLDAYAVDGQPRTLAAGDFLARLPQRLLAHPQGGALAAVGHVERTWGHSFLWKGRQTEVFEDALGLLLDGWPVGAALEPFGQRYAALSSELVEEQRRASQGQKTSPETRARLWTAVQDARNFILLGDPGVRIRTGSI